jgi:drug/metabolite transporter (DMT)-like permease
MTWVMFAIGAALSWGMYGPMLHKGQVALGSPMRALLCVGVAYLLVAILIPGGTLLSQGQLNNFNWPGTVSATVAGILGAFGAIFVIWAFRAGGVPNYVMPIVFGFAPLVNVLYTMYLHPRRSRRIRCSMSGSCWRRSEPGWCSTTSPPPEVGPLRRHSPRD